MTNNNLPPPSRPTQNLPIKGDYVLATKWGDGDPRDHWCVGFYDRCDSEDRPPATRIDPRHYVKDSEGNQFRHNGFRRVKKISTERGAFLLKHSKHIEQAGRSVWWWARVGMDEMTKEMDGKVGGLTKMKSGIELITEERARQISDENWTAAHDDDHENGELARAAATYALPESHRRMEMRTEVRDNARGVDDPPQEYLVGMEMPILWPWEMEWWKPCPDDRIRELVKAGALIAAEIDRLKRQHNE